MYSLICRHCNVGAVPAVEAEEVELPAGNPPGTGEHLQRAERIKRAMEGSPCAKACLLTVTLLGTCMVIGDGILTPCISGTESLPLPSSSPWIFAIFSNRKRPPPP